MFRVWLCCAWGRQTLIPFGSITKWGAEDTTWQNTVQPCSGCWSLCLPVPPPLPPPSSNLGSGMVDANARHLLELSVLLPGGQKNRDFWFFYSSLNSTFPNIQVKCLTISTTLGCFPNHGTLLLPASHVWASVKPQNPTRILKGIFTLICLRV